MQILYIILIIVASYLLGSIPFGLLVGKIFKGIDIRKHGSKNVGSTNVTRVLGFKYGILTFAFDMFKGALPILLVKWIFNWEAVYMINGLDIAIVFGAASAIGHIYPLYIGFKGGKAVATSVGAVVALSPLLGVFGIVMFFIVVFITGYASLASIVAATLVGIGLYLDVFWWQYALKGGAKVQLINLIIVTALVLLIIFKHRTNIVKLFKGTENKFSFSKKKKISEDTENKKP